MALVAVVALLYFLGPDKRPGKKGSISSSVDKSIAVLPFVNISDDKEQEYFSDGLTEEIINRLAGLPQLKVMARTSSFSFKGKNLTIQKIADSLRVSYIVEGSVRKAEKKIKVTVQLIRSSDGTHIWSKTYDQVLEDIFRIQEDIASNVARTLDIYLDEGKKEMMLYLGTRNVDAYENFLKGKAEFKRAHSPIGGSLWKANIFFERALAYDSAFSTAYWYQSDAYLHSLFAGSDILFATDDAGGFSPSEAYAKMNFLITKAIQYTSDTSIRNLYSLTKVFYSENWTDLPVYVNKFIHNEEAPKVMSYTETALGTYSLILAGKGAELYRICNEAVNYDPLQHLIWEKGIYAALSEGMLTEAAEFNSRGKQATGENHSEILALSLALGYKKEITAMNFSKSEKAIALTRDGQSARALAIADSLLLANPANERLIWLYHELKNREKANMIANEIDKKELGSLKLAMLLTTTNNLDPLIFDLKSTPNFAKRLQEAGIALKSSTD
jgi:TolB-like protein